MGVRFLGLDEDAIVDIVGEWYVLLSRLSASLSGPLGGLADRIQVAPLSAFLFGLMGATASCQISTNLSSIAYVSQELGSERPWLEATAYTLGKLVVYTLIGGVIIGLGQQIQGPAISVAVVTRRLLGPVMLLIGLVFLDVLRFRMSPGQGTTESLRRRLGG